MFFESSNIDKLTEFADILALKKFHLTLARKLRKDIKITVQDYSLLFFIGDIGRSFADIRRGLLIKNFQVTFYIHSLEKKGLVFSSPDLKYRLTDEGKMVLFECDKIFASIQV